MSAAGLHHRAEEAAAGLPPLLVAALRVAATVAQGVHGRRRVGPGDAFWQFRAYDPGDPPRSIDWRRSAKSGSVFVREKEWAAAESVWLWRDPSPSMGYRSREDLPFKRERAELLLVALGALLARGGERVALLGSARPPAADRATLRRIARSLEEEPLSGPGLPSAEPLPRHARLVLIGDFLAPLEETGALLRAFAGQGIRGHLLQVLDPAEESLPFSGRVHFEGPEAEGEVLIGRVEAIREDYHDLLAGHRRGLQAMASRQDWTFAAHHTGHPPETALLALFMALAGISGG